MIFQTTNHTQLYIARDDPAAMAALVVAYQKPILEFFRSIARNDDKAADLAQEFIKGKFLGGTVVQSFDHTQGTRFRDYLKECLRNFFRDVCRRPDRSVPLGSVISTIPDADWQKANDALDRSIAVTVMQESLDAVEHSLVERGRHRAWQVFEASYLRPLKYGCECPDIGSFMEEFGAKNPQEIYDLRSSVIKDVRREAKRRVGILVDDAADTETELNYYLSCIAAK